MNYLEYLKKELNKTLTDKIEERDSAAKGNNNQPPEYTPMQELEIYITNQYKRPPLSGQTLEEPPTYDRMETQYKSDDEIKDTAKALLSDYANQSKNAIENEINLTTKKYEDDKNKAKTSFEQTDAGLEELYKSAKENASNDVLKRGLARSSISANIVAGLEKDAADKRSSALSQYVASINSIDSEIADLEIKRQKALDDFNISYVAKLTEKIQSLTQARDSEVKEALKYNNSITEKEYDQRNQKVLDESKLLTDELTQEQKQKDLGKLTASQQQQVYQNIYQKMDEMLGAMSAKDAKKLIQSDDIFKYNLNEYYYYKLYDKYGR